MESILTRRNSARFELSPSVTGSLQTVHDVRLLSIKGSAVQVLCRVPGVKGGSGVLEFVQSGERSSVGVRIDQSIPVLKDGLIRYELTLVFTHAPGAPASKGNERD